MKTKTLVRTAMTAGIYMAISVVFAPLAYGAIQVRFSEALTLLPVFSPDAIIGVTIGCLLTNIIGSSPIDMVFGTLATLIAAIITYKLGKIRTKGLPLLAALPPILVNAVVIGFEITYFFTDIHTVPMLLLNMLTVGIGQIVSCSIGILLVKVIEGNPNLKEFFCE